MTTLTRTGLAAVLLVVICCAAYVTARAQAKETANRYRLAQSYEQSGDFENAVKLYRDLILAEPANYQFFDGLRRSLLQLKRYDEVIGLVRQRLASHPNDINLLCLLGSAQYQAGSEKEAAASWEQAIAVDPANSSVYRLVVNTMLENRLLERAAELYRRARKACNDPNLFTLDLAQLLAVTMDYAGATGEFLRYLQQVPTQLGYVQNRMSQFTGKEEGRAAAIEVVRAAQRQSDDVNLHRLLAWLMMEGKQFDEAFGVYKRIDRLSGAQGVELYTFAERAAKEKQYGVAADAYQEAIAVPLSSQRLPYAKYGYAVAMKELSDLTESAPPSGGKGGIVPETQARYATAVGLFMKLIEEYPNSEFAARSHYQIGLLQYEKYFDLDRALDSFREVEKVLPAGSSVVFDVSIKTAEVLTAKGDTAGALRRLRNVMAAPTATPDQQDEATYRVAELEYFGGNFTGAVRNLEAISSNLKADYANDALALLAFLQENTMTAEVPLREFARADFLARQQKYAEATAIFESLIDRNPQALFVDDGLMRVAALQERSGRYRDALATYQRLLTQFKESSIALDRAQFSIARLYDDHLASKGEAIGAYEKLLADYPNSLLIEKARKRIRELRGDSL